MVASKVLFSLAALVFGCAIVILSVLRVTQQQIHGEIITATMVPSSNAHLLAINQILIEEKINYVFPSPGILPDHPFYWLKMVRDRIYLIFTPNTQERLKLQAHYADKRLSAGYILITKGQTGLGVSTITKAEKYLHEALLKAEKLFESGSLSDQELRSLLKTAIAHQAILSSLSQNTTGQHQQVLASMQKLNQEFLTEAAALSDTLPSREASSSASLEEASNSALPSASQ
jgi:hypothetical protein